MVMITLPRGEITTDDVANALRAGLDAGYDVVPGMGLNNIPFARPHPNRPDTVLVGIGASTWTRAQARVIPGSGRTEIHISPGGLLGERLVNTFSLVRMIRRVLLDSPALRGT